MNITEKVFVNIFEKGSGIDDETLQGVVDLYEHSPTLTQKQKNERGLDHVDTLKIAISNGIKLIVAKNSENVVVGVELLKHDFEWPDELYLWRFSVLVHPDERNHGIGSKMEEILARAMQDFARRIKKKVIVSSGVEFDNPRSMNFHKKNGYKVMSTGEDAPHYEVFRQFFPRG